MRKGKFEVFKSKDQWYFRLKAGNGEIIATSEGYTTEQGALKGVASVQINAGNAVIEVLEKKRKKEFTKKQLVSELKKTEKDYEDKNKPEVVKPKEEVEDEKKMLVSGPIKSWKQVGPRWM